MALRTVFCVQTFMKKGRVLTPGPLRQFGTGQEALQSGESLKDRSAGVVVYSVEGEPAFDYWSEPKVLASHGQVPALAF